MEKNAGEAPKRNTIRCKCGEPAQLYWIQDEVWNLVKWHAPKHGHLCVRCVGKRLRRPLTLRDLSVPHYRKSTAHNTVGFIRNWIRSTLIGACETVGKKPPELWGPAVPELQSAAKIGSQLAESTMDPETALTELILEVDRHFPPPLNTNPQEVPFPSYVIAKGDDNSPTLFLAQGSGDDKRTCLMLFADPQSADGMRRRVASQFRVLQIPSPNALDALIRNVHMRTPFEVVWSGCVLDGMQVRGGDLFPVDELLKKLSHRKSDVKN